jgi:hypothetical protein
MSKGGQPQESKTSIDPAARQAYLDNLNLAKTTAGGLGVQQYAGFDPMYQAAEKASYEASMKPFGAEDIAAFQNPYEEQVVQQSLQDIDRQRQMQALRDAQQATASKAFGGSRYGVQASLSDEAALREAARTSGQLRSAGYTQAADLAQKARGLNLQGYQNAMNLGLSRQQYAQLQLDAQRNLPLQQLAIQQAAMSAQPANLGQTSSQSTTRNVGSNILGGALAGASIAGMPGMAALGPYGMIAGGLLGAFS